MSASVVEVRKLVAGAAPEIRDLVQEAAEQGWDVQLTGKGHIRLAKPGAELVFLPSTPSDWRSWHNSLAKLRRHGLQPKERRLRRERITHAVARQQNPDPGLEQLAQELLDELELAEMTAETLRDALGQTIGQLHTDGEGDLHAWDAAFCHLGCARLLPLLNERTAHGFRRHQISAVG